MKLHVKGLSSYDVSSEGAVAEAVERMKQIMTLSAYSNT